MNIYEFIKQPKKLSLLIFVILVSLTMIVGTYARIKFYRDFRSLWVDESCVALNIIERNYAQLLQPLDYEQGAPIGFLLVVKFITDLFNNYDENTLRLFSLISSLLSLYLFIFLSHKLLGKTYALFSSWMFSVHPGLIRFSSEVKQYSSDVLVFLIIAAVGIAFFEGNKSWRKSLLLCVTGLVAILFSHPAIFMLASIGVLWVYEELKHNNFIMNLPKIILCGLSWVGLALALYILNYSNLTQNSYLKEFWEFGFPLTKDGLDFLYWVIEQPYWIFNLRSENLYWGAAALLLLIGIFSSIYDKEKNFYIFLLPIIFTLLAAFLSIYPFADRMILFLVPSAILFVGYGLKQLTGMFEDKKKIPLVVISLLLISAIPMIWLVLPQERIVKREELSQVMKFVLREMKEDDYFYAYYGGRCNFLYYSLRFNLPEERYQIGSPEVQNINKTESWKDYFLQDVQKMSKKGRVWFIFSHYTYLDLESAVDILEKNGTLVSEINFQRGASAYLMEFPGAVWKERSGSPFGMEKEVK
ncbi:hypothetical protein [Bellilinea sp.]